MTKRRDCPNTAVWHMVSLHYYEILSIPADSSVDEVKRAYHALAKRNHPDLFPESERPQREMRMMRVNEAYMAVLCDLAEVGGQNGSATTAAGATGLAERPASGGESDLRSLGPLKDPAYVYYKLGFRYFSEGRRTFFKRYIEGKQRIDFVNESFDVLRLAVASLHYFHKAYDCFLTVSRDYPQSIWAKDAETKIYFLNRYNAIYQRICNNLSRQIRSATD